MSKVDWPAEVLFAGGRLCLDFVNTSCMRLGHPLELIEDPEELRWWLLEAGRFRSTRLSPEEAVWTPRYGTDMLSQAHRLRTVVDDLVRSVVEQRPPSPTSVDALNAFLEKNPSYEQVELSGETFAARTLAMSQDEAWLVRIAEDAVDLLTRSDLSLLRRCECPGCVRLFYDTTKNRKRRWCVEKCGNRAKAAAYYRRKKAEGAG